MAATSRAFLFWPSHVVNLEVMVRICRLELPALESSLRADDEELHLSAHVYSLGVRMAEVAISTHNPVAHDGAANAVLWDDALALPVKYRDLSRDATLVLEVYDHRRELVGGTTMRFFDARGALVGGKQKLTFYLGVAADASGGGADGGAGESVRVRAQNLRVQQDGPPQTAGYVEEYVWVQVQE